MGASKLGVLAAVAVTIATGVSACGGGSNAVDTRKLGDELARLVFFAKNAEGFDYDVRVGCTSSDPTGLRLRCHVVATTPGRPTNEWDEEVSCVAHQVGDEPRCVSGSGYALQ